MVVVSREFVRRLRVHPDPAYKIAWRGDVHPATLSKLIHGAERVRPEDERVIAVGRELGLSAVECFEEGA
jgi:hypothetical protein